MKPILFVAALSLATLAAGQTPHTFEQHQAIASGGAVVLTMNAGDLKILPGSPDRVGVDIRTKRPVDQETMAGWVRRFEVVADRATIDLHIPNDEYSCYHDCSIDVTLYLPQRTSLKADLDVGDITIHGVDGNMEVHTGVGDLHISVANPSDYGRVETHTRIGDIHDFLNRGSDQDGFLGKTENFTLSGRYYLKASTGIGDVHISGDGKS